MTPTRPMRLIRAAAHLVPRGDRNDWVREWEAELHYRANRLAGFPQRTRAADRRLTLHAWGAFFDAAMVRARSLHEGILLDLRHSLRGFRRDPGFVGFTLLLIVLGIGVNAAVFAVVDAVLLRPLPYPQPDRLVRVWEVREDAPGTREGPAPGNFQHWRRHGTAFASLTSWYESSVTLAADGAAETYAAAQVSNDFFEVFGVPPLLGRTFTDEEVDRAVYDTSNTHRGEGPVTVISHRLWVQRFGGDPEIVGRDIRLGRKAWQVVGVMPPDFGMPRRGIDVWIPWSFARDRPRDQRYTQVAGRLATGVPLAEAQERMTALAAEMARTFPESNAGWGAELVPLQAAQVERVRGTLWILMAAVGCVLGIAALNIAGLQIVRATARAHEVAIRFALGASRLRLVRQLLVEGLVLALAGGALGVGLAYGLVSLLRSLELKGLPRLDEVTVDLRVIGFAAVLTVVTGIVFGLAPVLGRRRRDLTPGLADEGKASTASRSRSRMRNALVVTEVAIAVALLVGAGLLLRSFERLSRVDTGFRIDHVLVLPIFLDGVAYGRGGTGDSGQYYVELMRRLEALPGVVSAGGATALPLSPSGPDFFRPVWREGQRIGTAEEAQADIRMATPGYFRTLGIPIVAGRAFDETDTPESQHVILVNESLARRHWPGQDPVGQDIVIDYASAGTYPYRVVGVTGDLYFYGPQRAPRDELYIPHAQRPYLIMNVAVRTAGPPEAMIEPVRRTVLELDPLQPVHGIQPLSRLYGETVMRDRLSAGLLGAFASLALLLAAAGLYGVLSYQVRRRSQEIGIRMALGARAGEIQRRVLGDGLRLVVAGLVLGLFAAASMSRWMAAELFEVRPSDPATLIAVATVMLAATVLACWLPARRAARYDPMRVLRRD